MKKEMKEALADIVAMDPHVEAEDLYNSGLIRIEDYGYDVTPAEVKEIVRELMAWT